MISAIVAVANNGVIGKSNGLPWYLPADLKHFRELTTGHPVIMGRTTFESIIARLGHALPDRLNIVLTRDPTYASEGAVVVLSIDAALTATEGKDSFVIGGAQTYELAADRIDRWYITEIDAVIDGDVTLRGFNQQLFVEVARENHPADEKNPYKYSFVTYERQ